MEQSLKQRYLFNNLPVPHDYDTQRNNNFQKLLVLISSTQRTSWLSTGFNCNSLIENYKAVYGLTSLQFETLIMLLGNLALKEQGLSTQTRLTILRCINNLAQLQIKITPNLVLSNRKLIDLLQSYASEGVQGTLKNSDAVIQELSKLTFFFSRFGQQSIDQALALSVDFMDIRYLLVFLRSLRTQAAALKILTQLFSDNNLWDRDCFWFFILGQVIKKFPGIDYSPYYQTIMQQAIRAITTIIQADNQDSLKKITAPHNFLSVQPVLKSVAVILANLMLPMKQPQHVFVNSCLQRIFNLVITSLDHINPPDYLLDLISFVRGFVRAYLLRYRNQRGLFLLYNQDTIQDYHQTPTKPLRIDASIQNFFDSLWQQIIPRVVYLQDGQQYKPSKLIVQLCMYKPQQFLPLALESIRAVAARDDPTLISLHGAKITMLFLQQYVISSQPEYLSAYVDSCNHLLVALSKLSISQNLDIGQLVLRSYLYFTQPQMQLPIIQTLTQDVIQLILDNMQSISVGLQGTQTQQIDLYVDFSNIFLPFFLKISHKQIASFADKFLYRISNQIPQHTQVYLNITLALGYRDSTFSNKVIQFLLKQMLSPLKQQKKGKKVQKQWQFMTQVQGSLLTRNQNILKWYFSLMESVLQYHPQNVIKHWPSIDKLVTLLLCEWQQLSLMDMACDTIFNVLLCLCRQHLPWQDYASDHNRNYTTLKLNWQPLTPSAKQLIDMIVNKYYFSIQNYLRKTYSQTISKNSSNLQDFETFVQKKINNDTIRVRKRNLHLADYVLMPQVSQDSRDKKIIFRALSMQYTVLSALMYRLPFHPQMPQIAPFLQQQQYLYFRPRACKYLQWVMQLLGHFNLLAEQSFLKLFNYFWRQSHDQVVYSNYISNTNSKLSPYFYGQMFRKKQLLRSSFLIVSQAYLLHMSRLELWLIMDPTAHINNIRYLQSNFILGLNAHYQTNLQSYFPKHYDVHQYYKELIAICRYHLDNTNPQSYLSRYLAQKDQGKQERINSAIKALLFSLKRLLNIFSDNSCMRDQFIRNTVFQIVLLFKTLPKKTDKLLIYQMIYVMLVFSFDPLCLVEAPQYSLSTYWQLRHNNKPQASQYQIFTARTLPDLQPIIKMLQQRELQCLQAISQARGLKMTRSCSYNEQTQISKQMQRAVQYLIIRIEQAQNTLEKDFSIYLLMVLQYSNTLPLSDPLIGRLTKLLFKISQLQNTQVFDMTKTGLFHILNRFNYHLRKSTVHKNTPVQRDWQQFLKYKYLGGEGVDYSQIKCDKTQYHFYPSRELTAYSYRQLGSDASQATYQNQLILLSVLQDQTGLTRFLKNCSGDPDLKQTDNTPAQALSMAQSDIKTISSSAHKLMHFIWDCNPQKTPLFMGVLQRYAAYPLNFYNRFFRKALRIGSSKTHQVCLNITQQLRKKQPQDIRMSFYISCQLMLKNPQEAIHKPFLDYLQECTKQNFDYALMGFYGIFTSNFVVAQNNYHVIIQKLRTFKGAPRLRHLEMLNTYILAQGRFARRAALQATQMMLSGITQGGDQISQAVVSMITQCYVQAVNLHGLKQWVGESVSQLVQRSKLFVLNDYVGYNHQQKLLILLQYLMKKAREQQSQSMSSKLHIYSQIVRKIVSSITIFRFNEYFYKMLRDPVLYILNKPQPLQDDGADQYVISQLCTSQYPQEVYHDFLEQLMELQDNTPYAIKKKLVFLQGMVIHRSFRLDRVDLPPLLSRNQKILTLDFIVTVSAMARMMKANQLTAQVQNILVIKNKSKADVYLLVSLLMASGVRQYQWKEGAVRALVKHKGDKLVKQSISEWWKGKSPQSEQQQRIAELVSNFDNPYNYFA